MVHLMCRQLGSFCVPLFLLAMCLDDEKHVSYFFQILPNSKQFKFVHFYLYCSAQFKYDYFALRRLFIHVAECMMYLKQEKYMVLVHRLWLKQELLFTGERFDWWGVLVPNFQPGLIQCIDWSDRKKLGRQQFQPKYYPFNKKYLLKDIEEDNIFLEGNSLLLWEVFPALR